MPYGELLVDQTLTDYNERFKFTGKERDDENGYLVIRPFGLPEELVMKTPNCDVITLKKL